MARIAPDTLDTLPLVTSHLQWQPLYEKVKQQIGDRAAYLYAWSVSNTSNCSVCASYFRKTIIENGEDPDQLLLNDYEKTLIDFGSAIAEHKGCIANHVYNSLKQYHNNEEMVLLVAFAGQMIATNIFNNVIETDLDSYLKPFLITE